MAKKSMVTVISLRNFMLSSTTGHTAQIEANVPCEIPEILVPDAMAAGCVLHDPNDAPRFDNVNKPVIGFGADMRKSLLYLATDILVKRNNPRDFAGGSPSPEAIEKIINMPVTKSECVSMYEAYQTAESSGVPYIIHDDAQDALRVIMADNKTELTELAVEFGKPEDEYHGLSSKALREYLLRHFHANIG